MTDVAPNVRTAGADALLDRLRRLDIQVWLDGDNLRVSAPPGAITPELRDELRANRDALRRTLGGAPLATEDSATAEHLMPLALAQERLWFFQELEPESAAYNVSLVLDLTGPLDVVALTSTLTAAVARHATLRTTVEQVDGIPTQRVHAPAPWSLRVVDLSGEAEQDLAARWDSVRKEDAERPFRLAVELPLRTTLVRLSPDRHQLVLTAHHIAADGYSLVLLIQELFAEYEALTTGCPTPVLAPASTYADFARQQRAWLASPAATQSLDYWRTTLAGELPNLNLPTDAHRPAVQTFRGAVQYATLPPATASAVRALSRRHGATPFMTMLAAFQAVLYRHTGDDDISVGSPVANRDRAETRDLIGMFVNTIVLRADLSGNPSFDALLGRVRQTARASMAHQAFPFARVVDELHPQRDTGRTPLFQAMFNMFTMEAPEELRVGELVIRPPSMDRLLSSFEGESKFDLTLYAYEQSDGMRLILIYNADLFSTQRMEALLEHYGRFIEAVVADSSRRIGDVALAGANAPVVGRAASHALRTAPFTRLGDAFAESSISERFAAVADVHPNRVAITATGTTLTYADLHQETRRVASLVAAAAPVAGARVALLFDNGAEAVSAILGVLAAGNVYVPLDASAPEERLGFILADAGAMALMCHPRHRALADRLSAGRIPVVSHDSATAGEHVPVSPPGPDSPAYILYTSGSTGQPKGILQNHRNVLHHARTYINALELTPDDRLTLVAPYTFDASVMDLFGALLTGADLHPVDLRHDGVDRLAHVLRRDRITVFHATPTVYRAAVAQLQADDCDTVRAVVLGGEEVRHEDIEEFERVFPRDSVFVNGLGPTESTTALQYFHRAGQPVGGVTVPVGFAVAGTDVVLLDESGEPTPVVGEIAVESAHVALGYWNQPALTAQAFFPIEGSTTRRRYRTGDLGRRRPDGAVEFLGRKDQQIKIRGVRIELGEIEAVLVRHPHVVQSAVKAERTGGVAGDVVLVGFVVLDAAGAVSMSELTTFMAASLPDNMVPAALVELSELPLTRTGKVDRRALPTPANLGRGTAREFIAPRDAVEQLVSDVWSEVLGVRSLGVHDNFFELGGQSLNATQVVARLREMTKGDLPLRSLFNAPTIEGLAEHIREQAANGYEHEPALEPRARAVDAPLSYSQERMWFLQQLIPDGTAYNMVVGNDVHGPLDRDAFVGSLQDVAERQESLRTTFDAPAGEPRQHVAERAALTIVERDLRELPADERMAAARAISSDWGTRPFDIERGPLWWALLLRVDDDRHIVTLGFHHIIGDLWSFGVLGHEIARYYEARTAGAPAQLSPMRVQYGDYAIWQREWLDDRRLRGHLEYWTRQLAGIVPLELPTDRPRPPMQTANGAGLVIELPASLVERVRALSVREGATPFMAFFAAFNVLLHRYSGQDDIVVGVPIANRTHVGAEGIIGTFVNTLVHRNDLSGDPSFVEFLRRVRGVALDAFTHQDLPFERLVRELAPERDASRSPVFQVMFNMANAPRRSSELQGITVEPFAVERAAAQFDLSFSVTVGERSGVSASFNTDLFDTATIERLLTNYVTLLDAATRRPEQAVGRLAIMPEAERRALLSDLNVTDATYPAVSAGVLIATQAAATPDAIAVEAGAARLTYAELDRRTNQFANHLRRLGVERGSLVGVCLNRSVDLVVALIGVLKVGAGYVPIDPSYPAHRVQFMIRDSAATLVVTESSLAGRLPETDARLVVLDRDADVVSRESTDAPSVDVQPSDRAYVIFTSGSTGEPKGVQISHDALVNFLWSMRRVPGMTANDVLLAITTVSFDIAGLELYLPLVTGATVVLADRQTATDGRRLRELLVTRQPSVMQATPATWRSLIDAGWEPGQTPNLKILCGGEALPRDLAQELLVRAREVWNVYGPTETTIWSTAQRVEPGVGSVPIGTPIANTRVYVLDPALQIVPAGVPGELYIGGAGVAIGYLNREELTASRFVDDPFVGGGARMYRTGDRARVRADGTLDHMGRLDNQVKLRGYRIELGEIESILATNPALARCVVDVRQDRLVAYVVFADGQELTASEIRAFLRETLPDFMVPSLVVPLDALPLTPNGKIDRRALPDPLRGAARARAAFAPPATPTELAIAAIWREALGVERVSTTDNFFELGGHSLLSMRVVHEIHRQTGWRPDPRLLFFENLASIAAAKPAVGSETI